MSAPGPGSVENTAAILRTICGRSTDGRSSMCVHDHLGEAQGLITQIRIAHLRELAARPDDIYQSDLTEEANGLERDLVG